MRPRLAASLFVLAALVATASLALAQAAVSVNVRKADGSAGEATVRLTASDGGRTFSCRTDGGRCTISGVPGGRFVVTAEPRGEGQRPAPHPILIPPSGDVSVVVTLQ